MRLMSFAATIEQMRDQTKTVTRRIDRKGWWAKVLQPGTLVCACEKTQGIPKGGTIQRIGVIEIVDVSREILGLLDCPYRHSVAESCAYRSEVVREGFPDMEPRNFVELFCDLNSCGRDAEITRIEFKHRPDLTTCCGASMQPGHADFGESVGCTNWYVCSECGVAV